jgi:hypothetical protein
MTGNPRNVWIYVNYEKNQEIRYASYSPEMLSKIDRWLDTLEDASYVASIRELIAKFHKTCHEIDNTLRALSLDDEINQINPFFLMFSHLAKDFEAEQANIREIDEMVRKAG